MFAHLFIFYLILSQFNIVYLIISPFDPIVFHCKSFVLVFPLNWLPQSYLSFWILASLLLESVILFLTLTHHTLSPYFWFVKWHCRSVSLLLLSLLLSFGEYYLWQWLATWRNVWSMMSALSLSPYICPSLDFWLVSRLPLLSFLFHLFLYSHEEMWYKNDGLAGKNVLF